LAADPGCTEVTLDGGSMPRDSLLRLYGIATGTLPRAVYSKSDAYIQLWFDKVKLQLDMFNPDDAEESLEGAEESLAYMESESIGLTYALYYSLSAAVEARLGRSEKANGILQKGYGRCPKSEHGLLTASWQHLSAGKSAQSMAAMLTGDPVSKEDDGSAQPSSEDGTATLLVVPRARVSSTEVSVSRPASKHSQAAAAAAAPGGAGDDDDDAPTVLLTQPANGSTPAAPIAGHQAAPVQAQAATKRPAARQPRRQPRKLGLGKAKRVNRSLTAQAVSAPSTAPEVAVGAARPAIATVDLGATTTSTLVEEDKVDTAPSLPAFDRLSLGPIQESRASDGSATSRSSSSSGRSSDSSEMPTQCVQPPSVPLAHPPTRPLVRSCSTHKCMLQPLPRRVQCARARAISSHAGDHLLCCSAVDTSSRRQRRRRHRLLLLRKCTLRPARANQTPMPTRPRPSHPPRRLLLALSRPKHSCPIASPRCRSRARRRRSRSPSQLAPTKRWASWVRGAAARSTACCPRARPSTRSSV
jgi:hypothetical protein